MGVEEGNEKVYVDTGWYIPLVLVVAMWINDTMAYLVGSWIWQNTFFKNFAKKNLGRNCRRCYPVDYRDKRRHEIDNALQQYLELDIYFDILHQYLAS